MTCSWDDTMTDLMCHPQDYPEWVEQLAASLRGATVPSADGTTQVLPRIPLCPAIPFAAGSCHCNGAGHSGMMQLAANLVRSLFLQHNLARMLAGDVDMDNYPPVQHQRSRILQWLPSASRYDLGNLIVHCTARTKHTASSKPAMYQMIPSIVVNHVVLQCLLFTCLTCTNRHLMPCSGIYQPHACCVSYLQTSLASHVATSLRYDIHNSLPCAGT